MIHQRPDCISLSIRNESPLVCPARCAWGIIAVVGGAIMDVVYEVERMPEQEESLDALSLSLNPGDKGSNTAVAISRSQRDKPKDPKDEVEGAASNVEQQHENQPEVRVFLNSAVGRDHFGGVLVQSLKENGVDTSGIRVLDESQTGTCAVFVEKTSRNCRDIGFPGANTHWTQECRDSVKCLAAGNNPDLIVACLENSHTVVEDVLATAHEHGVDTLLNPSPAYRLLDATYQNVTHLLLNEVEVAELAGIPKDLPTEDAMLEACTYFMERGVKHVVITLGARGSFYATDGAHGLVEAVFVPDKDIKDTTGAG